MDVDMDYGKMTKIELIRKLMTYEEQFTNTFEQVAVGIAHVDLNGQFIKINRHFCDIIGYSEQEILKSKFHSITYPDDIYIQNQFRNKVLDGENTSYTIEKRYIRKDNSLIWVNLTVTLIRKPSSEPHYFISIIKDITEQKKAEKRLNAQHAVTQVLAESATLGEIAPKILQAICETLEWDHGEIWEIDHLKNVLYNTESWHVPSVKVQEFIDATKQITFPQKVGLPGTVWDSAEPLWIADATHDTNFPRASFALKAGLHGAFGFPIIIGSEVLGTICFYSHEIREPDNDLLEMMMVIGSQIGLFIKRKQAEEALLRSEKLQSLGTITAGIAHEFNNMLTIISCNAQWLEEGRKDDKELMDTLCTIMRATNDGIEISRKMLKFAKTDKNTEKFTPFNINELIDQAIDFTMPRWKNEAKVKSVNYHMDTEGMRMVPYILCNPTEIREVFVNIINNALDAMPDGGTNTVTTRCVRNEELGIESKRENASDLQTQSAEFKCDFVEITFADTGEGMPEEVMKNIFEPFFSTKKAVGTGLGMSISYGIITSHGGKIELESEVGKGTKFILKFPVADKEDDTEETPFKV
jgi:two-component system cell cycle sensor histidine kinase/response regulator CckA